MSIQAQPSTERATQSTKTLAPFIAYLALFFAAWTGYALWVYPHMAALGDATLTYALVNLALGLTVWALPVFLYLRFIDQVNPFVYLKLGQFWRRGVIVGLSLSALNFLGAWLRFGTPHLTAHAITWNSVLSTSILIGVIEEIPFRGFMFQKLQERMRVWGANLVSSLLFLGIHLPGWISLHLLTVNNVVSIFALGVIFAAAFYVTKSLWSAIVMHSLNDFLTSIVFSA